MEAEEEGYVRAQIQQQQGAFDAGTYGFFGDMAPLDEGLGGALEDGLDAPPEEWPAQGALEDDEDLPIEALMDENEEEEDLSLAALLRRQMLAQQEEEHGSSASSSKQRPAPAKPSGMLSAADLEARMISSANQQAAQQQQQQLQAPGGQLLSMLKAGGSAAAAAGQQQQQLLPPRQLSSLPGGGVPPPGHPGMPMQGPSMPFGPGMMPPGAPGSVEQQQALLQQLPDGLRLGPPYSGMPPPPPPQMGGHGMPPGSGLYGGLPPHMLPPPPHPLQGGPGPLAAGALPHPMHGGMHGPPMPPPGHPGMLQQGQLVPPPQRMPPPGFPGASPGQQLQQPMPGLKGMPPMQQPHQQPMLGLQQQQQQQPGIGAPYGAAPPRQQSPGGAPWIRHPSQQQQQQQGMQQGMQHSQQQGSPAARFPPAGAAAAAGGVDGGIGVGNAAGAGGEHSIAAMVHRLRSFGSEMMAADEINYILRIQHMATHGGHPYMEDFYYQAYLNKYFGGRNALVFAPAELRDLASEHGAHEGSEPRFADLSGLGKIVLSNIRTPKMLMDVGGGGVAAPGADRAAGREGPGQQGPEGKAKPLEQEPMLAARIMIEDCMLLLSDVEDIDRMFAAAAAAAGGAAGGMAPQGGPVLIAPAQAQMLLHRRAALLGGIAASFRLPNAPTLPSAKDGAAAATAAGGDGVFIRLMGLPKGRALVNKTLRLMFSAPPSAAGKGGKGAAADAAAACAGGGSKSVGLDVIWALLRNAELTFGPAVAAAAGSEAGRRMTNATVALSAAASEMVKRLSAAEEAVACLAACIAGLEACAAATTAAGASQLLPLFPAGRLPADGSPDWLGGVLASLLLRSSELGLGSFAAAGNMRTLGEGYDKGARELAEQEARESGGGAGTAAATEWSRLLGRFAELVMLHLWALLQAVKGGGMAAAAGGAAVDVRAYVQQLSCVPLMRVLIAHCDAPQQEQLKSYLSELSH
ncbi:hypothetical protein COO60DRAFT_1699132 [Scenedesmus sp. NREL 46B-D3]|nr:hypothetical protein COO60DRAFT_1699132 [Scenedesmus sp. NREL 46B-D3]